MITLPLPARPPSCAYFQAVSISLSERTSDWPLPEELMIGFITQGIPISSMPAVNSS